VSDTECHSITTKHGKANEPLSCHRQTKLSFIAMESESTSLSVKQAQGSMAMFPAEHCISEQQIILVSFVKNVLGDGKEAKNLKL
jgi:phosphoribosylaminoimidazole carboxylase (NCAIR synthetase)